MIDQLSRFSLVLVAIPWVALGFVAMKQCRGLREGAERLSVLNMRIALFLPLYATCIMVGVLNPDVLSAMDIPMALVDSYCFYTFFILIVTNLGGVNGLLSTMDACRGPPGFCSCCSAFSNPMLYDRARGILFHLMVTRNILVVIAVIADYTHTRPGRFVNTALIFIATCILFRALTTILLIYDIVYAQCSNTFNIWKVLLFKFSVGLVVLEGLLVVLLTAFRAQLYHDDQHHTAEEKLDRGYCLVLLMQFVAFSVPYVWLWASPATPRLTDKEEKAPDALSAMTSGRFCLEVLKVWDVFGMLSAVNMVTVAPAAPASLTSTTSVQPFYQLQEDV